MIIYDEFKEDDLEFNELSVEILSKGKSAEYKRKSGSEELAKDIVTLNLLVNNLNSRLYSAQETNEQLLSHIENLESRLDEQERLLKILFKNQQSFKDFSTILIKDLDISSTTRCNLENEATNLDLSAFL